MLVGVYEIDLSTGLFVNVDKVICEHLGYTQDELRGQPVTMVLESESILHFRERMMQLAKGNKVDTKANFTAVTKGGQEIPITIEAFFEIRNGTIVGAIVAAKARTENDTDT